MTEDLNAPRALFDQIARDLALNYDGVTTGKIFGKACIKTHGKALDGAQLWDPSGKHRPMKEWVQIPFACAHAWPAMAARALSYVEQ
jgi:hypothetical protein